MTTYATDQAGEDAKALFNEVIERVWHRGETAFIDEAYSPEFVGRVPRSGYQSLEDYKLYVQETLDGIPDVYFHVKEQYVDGCHLITRFQLTGTHTGDLLGVPPTRRAIDVEGVVIHRFGEDGRFVESWTVWDVIGLCHEIGLVPELAELP